MTGVWDVDKNAETGLFKGAATLVLGQFGEEVAGYVEFRNRPGASGWADCKCSYLSGPFRVDVNAQSVEFTTDCAVPNTFRLDWKLQLESTNGTNTLSGVVTRSDGAGSEDIDLMRRTATLPDPSARVCDP